MKLMINVQSGAVVASIIAAGSMLTCCLLLIKRLINRGGT